jgi:hypothetical protein
MGSRIYLSHTLIIEIPPLPEKEFAGRGAAGGGTEGIQEAPAPDTRRAAW